MPPEPPTLWVVLAWIRRDFTRNYLNKTPTAMPVQTSQTVSGMVRGTINGTDAEGDPLTYRITGGPARGEATVTPFGAFTYTPDTALAATGGSDTFTVTVAEADSAARVHGFFGLVSRLVTVFTLGLIRPDDGSSVTVSVTVTVPAARPDPRVVGAIDVSDRPVRLAVHPDGTRAYGANLGGSVSVIDLN